MPNLKRGKYQRDATPGAVFQLEYMRWYNMCRRCYNPAHKKYPRYGGRGITVCDRWLDSTTNNGFDNFVDDMGKCPPGMSIERINNDLGYSKENCKWATTQEQQSNREYCTGISARAKPIADRTGIHLDTIIWRLTHGWTEEEAEFTALNLAKSGGHTTAAAVAKKKVASITGLSMAQVYRRLSSGWTIAEIEATPRGKRPAAQLSLPTV